PISVCDAFYFPYARKLWGLAPEEISAAQARSRVSANSVAKIVCKAFSAISGNRNGNGKAGKFYYPSEGFGQICEAMAGEVRRLGGKIRLSKSVVRTELHGNRVKGIVVSPAGQFREAGQPREEIAADIVFSTIPVTDLAASLAGMPAPVARACASLRYRGMVFLYLVLETDRFTPYDAHYFPESDFIFSRISEPKNYNGSGKPRGTTGLCLEIPCTPGDRIWNASAEEISDMAIRDMSGAGLPIRCPVRARFIRRHPRTYPVYDMDYAGRFREIDEYLGGLPGLVCLGRQALFVHDNVHHAIAMAYRASECLGPGLSWNAEMWRNWRREFSKNTVED
ncbi:MAG: FAD-dependent oxidoreductase, partial [Nitrospiraceae bacterium]|nr:FAD-dependent oxidoreductase [Nitrospiraceae bacterium]